MGSRVTYDRTFGDWLGAQLKEAGGNRAQLARYLGPDGRLLAGWLAGRERPTAEACERIAAALGLPTRTVLTKAGLRPERAVATIAASESAAVAPPPDARGATPRSENAMSPAGDAALPLPLLDGGDGGNGVGGVADNPDPASAASTGAEVVRRTPRRRRTRRPPAVAGEADEQPSIATPIAELSPTVPAPPRPSPMLERIAALRALADDLERAARDQQRLSEENEQLRQERDRLAEANRRLQAQIDHVRAALFPDDARRA
jgi:transcriptional regulator with XRE-family HTH domain